MPGNRVRLRQLERLYAQVPDVKCRGLCQEACGPIGMTELEVARMEAAAGRPLPLCGPTLVCPLLGADGRCSVYAVRPMVCRQWGAVESMPCPHGCRPGRMLSHEEGQRLLDSVREIGGEVVFTVRP